MYLVTDSQVHELEESKTLELLKGRLQRREEEKKRKLIWTELSLRLRGISAKLELLAPMVNPIYMGVGWISEHQLWKTTTLRSNQA